jgi:hypothetical protein
MAELQAKNFVALLGVLQRGRRELGFLGIEVQVDVRTLQDLPVELAVLDLVLAQDGKLRSAGVAVAARRTTGSRSSRRIIS